MTSRPSEVPIDAILQRIIVGFRLVSAVWVTVLGTIGMATGGAVTWVVAGALGLVWVWTAVTYAVMRAGRLQWLPWLIVDFAVTIIVVVADSADGSSIGNFSFGYPMTSVLLWGYAYRIPGGIGSAVVLSTAVTVAQSDFTGYLVDSVLYLAVGGVAAWAWDVLRNNERRRLAAEAELESERAARIRSEERADVAAHLHDSVLQTLALIQKGSSDPVEVRNLARVQERELRSWLLGGGQSGDSLVAALEAVCSDVERRFGIAVELVAVGDRRLDEHLQALVAATGESMTNAAKHSGVEQVSVYVEAGTDPVQVFIRDRGSGFDPDDVAADRRGLADSVRGRMERHGGRVDISSGVGTGTEVRLSMPAPGDDDGGR